ncbi:TM2 domain-containing protein [Paucidesulfovibrio longus]|uniref:TM2 domain-containing protein n=1 Tax=Paucidesulfovibrio longus TaxID=889 RepID=UPI00040139B4|nr:TM2 domain-containing protein [Paucidesulfovibrio longus]
MEQENVNEESVPSSAYADEWKWLLGTIKRPAPESADNAPRRVYSVAVVLSLLLGWTGLDRFYLGKIGTGILKMITLGGLFIWWLIDLYLLVGGKPKDVNGVPLEGSENKETLTYLILTVFGAGLGVHYLYLGFRRLCFTRLGVSLLYYASFFWYNSNPFRHPTGSGIFFWPLLLIVILWQLLDLYLVITGRIRTDAEGEALVRPKRRYQSVCLLLAIMGGFFGMDRFYLGHRVLGILKIFTLGGLLMWYLLDIVLAILNVHKDSEGQALLQE